MPGMLLRDGAPASHVFGHAVGIAEFREQHTLNHALNFALPVKDKLCHSPALFPRGLVMLFLAGLLGAAAIGASAFVGLGTQDEDPVTEDPAPDGKGEGNAPDDPSVGESPDLLAAAMEAVMGQAGDASAEDAWISGAPAEAADCADHVPGTAAFDASADEVAGDPAPADHASADPAPDAGTTKTEAADAQAGSRIVGGSDADETIIGDEGAEMIGARGGDDTIAGGAGDDEIRSGAGLDELRGGAGDDTLHGEDGADALHGDAGDDRLFGHNDADTLRGGEGDDSLVGSAGDDTLFGGAGDDALHGDLDDDRLDGGMGSDTLFGGHGNDTVSGIVDDPATRGIDDIDTGRDYLNGGGGDDAIVAGRGDIVTSGSGSDTVMLGNWLDAEPQAQILDFSVGEDMLMVFYDAAEGAEPELALEPDPEDPASRRLLLDGAEIAYIADAAGMTLDHVALVPQTQMPALTGAGPGG